jgi:cardiolipin synthase
VLVQILESNVRRERLAIQHALRLTIKRAVERCWLTTPYFLPPGRLLRAMRHAARRGVDVRLLTAGRSDVPLVRVASRHLYSRLLERGVRIFELQQRALHAKVVIVDGIYASVGSFNLDAWSWHRNLEVTVGTLDRGVCSQLGEQFLSDLERSVEIDPSRWGRRSLFQRAVAWLTYQVMRL